MSNDYQSKDALRAAFALRELDKSQRALSGGLPGLIIRVALVTVFMYLLVIAYQLMGTTGTVLVSIMFLISVFIPALARMVGRVLAKRRAGVHPNARKFESKARTGA